MARYFPRIGLLIGCLLALSLLLLACGQASTEVALSLPTADPSVVAAKLSPTATSQATAAATTSAANPDATATPVVIGTQQVAGRTPTVVARPAASPSPRPTLTPRAIKPPTGFSGKLSIMGADNAVYISRFDGSQPQVVLGTPGVKPNRTSDGPLFDWPTWTNDGSKLAVIGVNVKGGSFGSSDIFVIGADGKNPYKILNASPDQPIFISWSPDGNLLSLLVGGGTGNPLELRLVDTSKGPTAPADAPRKVAQGSSIYTGWSPDSQQLLIHAMVSATDNTVALLSAKDSKAQAVPIKGSPSAFRSPAFSVDGARLAFAVLNSQSGNEEINIIDKGGSAVGSIEVGGRGATFNWSPGGNRLAHTYLIPNGQGLYKGIALTEFDTAASGKLTATQVVNEPVASFFWSPDGKKLAFLTVNDQGSLLIWKLYDLDTKKVTQLTEWLPSDSWIQMIRFFDQYAQSNSVWSPDSKALVFSGFSKEDVATLTGQSPDDIVPTVYIMPVDGSAAGKLTAVAPGNIAFWTK